MAAVLFAILCAAWLPISLQQIVPADLGLSGFCPVSQEALRVLPSSGFTRSVLQPFTNTTLAGSQEPLPLAANLTDCLFQSYDPAFDAIIGDNRTVYQVGPTRSVPWAVESPAYLPDTDEIIFASYFVSTPSNLSRLSLTTGEATTVPVNPPIGNAGGATRYQGKVAFASVGDAFDDANPPGAFLVDPYSGKSSILMNNFFGIRFNGFDDIHALNDGSLILTDSNYTSVTPGYPPFKNAAVLPNDVWILPTKGPPRVLIADLPNCPNGIATSPDDKILYISVGPLMATDPYATASVNLIYAYDLVNIHGGIFATGQRVFAKSDNQYFDGFSVDGQGNIFAATGDGVAVISPAGVLLGKIVLPAQFPIAGHPVNSIGFAGDRLIVMHNVNVFMIPLNTTSIPKSNGS